MGVASAADGPAGPPSLRRARTTSQLDSSASPPRPATAVHPPPAPMTATSSTAAAARRRANTTLAAAAAEAAAAAAALAASSTRHNSSTFSASIHPIVDPVLPHSASGEVVETLYSHPAAKIISFNAGARNYSVDWGASSSSSASRSRSTRRSTMDSDDNFAPGTLPWSSQFERTIAVSSLSIYRAPGSVAFLSCGSALQPILPKSQCWCIDEESSKFILQIRRPQFWRIEIPVGDEGENDELARRFRDVLDHVLQFEKTPCPFKRSFTVELPQQPSTPPKKKPWTPVKRPDHRGSPSSSASSLGLPARPTTPLQKQPQPARPRSSSPVSRRVSLSPSPSPQPEFSSPDQPIEYTRREWAAMLERRKNDKNGKNGGSSTDEYDDEGNRIVPALVAEHERIIMEVKASEIEVNKMGTPWRKSSSVVGYATTPTNRPKKNSSRDRSLSLAGDSSASRPTDWPTGDRKWSEVIDSDVSTTESSPMNSIRSWLSPSSGRTMSISSPVSSTDSLAAFPLGSGDATTTTTPAGLTSLFEDARRIFNNATPTAPGSAVSTATEVQQPPRYRHRATTSSISVSNIPSLPPAVNILTPARHLRSAHASGRATTRLEAVRRIPGSIMYRVLEIMLAPPSYLISLMLRVAARILSGEWRGFAVGKTDAGESIPVEWDYSDVEDPLGFKSEMARRRAGRNRGVFDTSIEDVDEDGHVFSSSSTPKRHERGVHTDEDDAGDDRIVWTRRWAVD